MLAVECILLSIRGNEWVLHVGLEMIWLMEKVVGRLLCEFGVEKRKAAFKTAIGPNVFYSDADMEES